MTIPKEGSPADLRHKELDLRSKRDALVIQLWAVPIIETIKKVSYTTKQYEVAARLQAPNSSWTDRRGQALWFLSRLAELKMPQEVLPRPALMFKPKKRRVTKVASGKFKVASGGLRK